MGQKCEIRMVSYNVSVHGKARSRGYKKMMLNSTEHVIFNAHNFKNIKKFSIFQAQTRQECYFPCSCMLKCQQLLAL